MKIFGFGASKTLIPHPIPVAEPSTHPVAVSNETAPDSDETQSDLDDVGIVSTPVVHAFDEVATAPDEVSDDVTEDVVTDDAVSDAATDDSAQVVPTSIQTPLSEPLRALFSGSFLSGQYEIKEVISRGPINFYLADAGDYGAHDWKFIGERAAVANEIEEGGEGPEAEFFPLATRFVQDEREYAIWDFQILTSLEEWSAKPNDETYLSVMKSVARGFSTLENAGLKADLPPSCLFFDNTGELRFFGFFDKSDEENPSPMSAPQQLSALSSRFAKTNLAARATLRLDDEFGALPFSLEVKGFARVLSDGAFGGASDVVAALEAFAPFSRTEIALLSDVGMERELNEDCGLIWKSSRAGHTRNFSLELLAVADGMGGHEGGEVASDLTLSALESAIARRQNLDFSDNAVVLAAMSENLSEVNAAVVSLTENPPYASMRAKPGATLVCALRVGPRVFLGNVGDSRAYKWNEKSGLERLTKDHSYVQDLLDNGSISEAEAWGHPDGSVITSHIGMMRGLKKDVFLRLLRAGDRLVLVSDGVVDTLRDAEIEAVIAANNEVEALSAALVNAANNAGGFDNITVAALICR